MCASPHAASQNRAESTVLLHVSHSNLKAKFFELRLDMHVRRWQALGGAASMQQKRGVSSCCSHRSVPWQQAAAHPGPTVRGLCVA